MTFFCAESKTFLNTKDWSPRTVPLIDTEVSHQIFRSGMQRIELGVTRPGQPAIKTFVWDGKTAKSYIAEAKEFIVDLSRSNKPGGLDYETWFNAPSSMTYADILRERPNTKLEGNKGDQCILYTPPASGQFELSPFGFRVSLDMKKNALPSRIEYLLAVSGQEVVSTRSDITLEKVAPGVWAPVKCTTAVFPPIVQNAVPPRKLAETVGVLSRGHSKFNKEIPETAFRLESPLGARVVDRTGEHQAAVLFAKSTDVEARISAAITDARLGKVHVLLILGMPEDRASHQLARLYQGIYDNDLVFREKLGSYRAVGVNAKDPATVKALSDFDASNETLGPPALLVLSADGKVVGVQSFAPAEAGGKIDRKAIEKFLAEYKPSNFDAQLLLDAALEQARRENKRVYIQETSMSCAPCLSMSRFLDQHKAIIDQDFIVLKMFRERYANGGQVMDKVRKDNSGGIPWVAILDAQGNVLASSNDAEGKNIGFPYETAGIEHFLKMLSSTGQRITPDQVQQLRQALVERAKVAPKSREPATDR